MINVPTTPEFFNRRFPRFLYLNLCGKQVSSSLLTAKPVWFDETHDDIVEGCIASGAIAPLVWPVHTRK